MRRSASMKSLNRDRFHDDGMSRSFDAQSMGGRSMGRQQNNFDTQSMHGSMGGHPMGGPPGGHGGPMGGRQGGPQMGGHPMGGGHTYTNVIPDTNSVDYSTDPRGQPGDARDPRGSLGRRSNR